MRILERRSPDGDTQHWANTDVPTTPPLRVGYGTIGICQGSSVSGGVVSDTPLPKTDCAVVSEASVVGTSDFGKTACREATCVQKRKTIMRAERTFPSNCEVRNSNPSRLLLFLDRQREIFGEYGFMLGVKLRTEEEREGKKRYQRDWHKRYRDEHRAEQRVRRHDYWVTVEKRGFKCKLEAVAPERLAEKREKAIRRKERADQKKLVRQEYGFDLHVTPRTPEEEAGRRRYRLEMMREYRRKIRETDPARREENNARRREMNRRRFEERMRELERVDPVAAAKERERFENRCRLIAMSEEERVERRERKLAEKRRKAKAAAKLKEKRKKAKARRAEQAAINTKRNVKRFGEMVRKRARIKRIEINKRKKEERQERWRNRIAECAARREAEKALEEKYRREREENLKRYLERKGRREKG